MAGGGARAGRAAGEGCGARASYFFGRAPPARHRRAPAGLLADRAAALSACRPGRAGEGTGKAAGVRRLLARHGGRRHIKRARARRAGVSAVYRPARASFPSRPSAAAAADAAMPWRPAPTPPTRPPARPRCPTTCTLPPPCPACCLLLPGARRARAPRTLPPGREEEEYEGDGRTCSSPGRSGSSIDQEHHGAPYLHLNHSRWSDGAPWYSSLAHEHKHEKPLSS